MRKQVTLLLLFCVLTTTAALWTALFRRNKALFCSDYRTEYLYRPKRELCLSACHAMNDCAGFCFSRASNSCRIHGPHNMMMSSTLVGNTRYKLLNQVGNYSDSRQRCADIKGYPAAPTSPATNEVFRSLITGDTWVGVRKWNFETRLESNGQKIVYNNFGLLEGFTLVYFEDCVLMSTSGKWKDTPCGYNSYPVLCQSPGTNNCDAQGQDVTPRNYTTDPDGSYVCYRPVH